MKRELKGVHVLLSLIAFFGVTIGVNAAMATYAITTFSGEDISDPYVNGLAYNKTLDARSAQSKLQWTATIGATRAAGTTSVDVVLRDREQRDVRGLIVEVAFRRPTNAKLDRTEVLSAWSDGSYFASVPGLAPGVWDLTASTIAADGTRFEATRRVLLK